MLHCCVGGPAKSKGVSWVKTKMTTTKAPHGGSAVKRDQECDQLIPFTWRTNKGVLLYEREAYEGISARVKASPSSTTCPSPIPSLSVSTVAFPLRRALSTPPFVTSRSRSLCPKFSSTLVHSSSGFRLCNHHLPRRLVLAHLFLIRHLRQPSLFPDTP
jgi:hypothetical protein